MLKDAGPALFWQFARKFVRSLMGLAFAITSVMTFHVGAGAGLLGLSEISQTSSTIYDIDPSTGMPSNPRTITTAPNATIHMMACSPSGVLYGVSQVALDLPPGGKLYTIPIDGGAATLVAPLTQVVSVEGDMAFDPTSGTLYAVDGDGLLFTINASNGVCTVIGTLPDADYSAMAFTNEGELYIWSTSTPNLLRVDKTNAAIISSVSPPLGAGGFIAGMAFDPLSGVAYLGTGSAPLAHLFTLNTTTGAITPIGPIIQMDCWALTFLAVPETGVNAEIVRAASVFALNNNPLRMGPAIISLSLARPEEPRVRVFDISGRLVRTIEPGPLAAGEQRISWDIRDSHGQPLESGVYFVRVALGSSEMEATKKLVILK